MPTSPPPETLGGFALSAQGASALRGCADGELRVLTEIVAVAAHRNDEEMSEASGSALRFIPRPFRGLAAGLLLPGGHHG